MIKKNHNPGRLISDHLASKTILLFLLIFVGMASSVFAESDYEDGWVIGFDFEDAADPTDSVATTGYDFNLSETAGGTLEFNTTHAYKGTSLESDATKYIHTSKYLGAHLSGGNPRTVTMWVYLEEHNTASWRPIFELGTGAASANWEYNLQDASDNTYMVKGGGGGCNGVAMTGLVEDQWNFIAVTQNTSNLNSMTMFTNDEYVECAVSTVMSITNYEFFLTSTSTSGDGVPINALFDEVNIWNRSLTDEEIEGLRNMSINISDFGGGAPPGGGSAVISGQVNGSHVNANASNGLNISATLTGLTGDCTLWRQIEGIGPENNLTFIEGATPLWNYSDSTYPSSWNGSSWSQYQVRCEQDTVNSSILQVWVDNVLPSFTWSSPDLSWDNTTVFNNPGQMTPLRFNITWRDVFLYRANASVWNGSGHMVASNQSAALDGINTYIQNFSIDLSDQNKEQTFKLLIEAVDSSTIQKIKDYKVTKDDSKKELKWETAEGNNIKIRPVKSNNIKSFKTEKKGDRYEIEYILNEISTYEDFEVECDGDLVPQYNTGKEGHFVCDSGMGGNWIDFENVGTVYRTKSQGKWTVRVFPETTELQFHSLGGLNYVNYTMTWNLTGHNYTIQVQKIACDFGNVDTFNLTATSQNHSFYSEQAGDNHSLIVWNEAYNFTFSKAGYANITNEYDVDTDGWSIMSGAYNSILNITAYGSNGTRIFPFTASYSHGCGVQTNTSSPSEGYLTLKAIDETLDLTISAFGWVPGFPSVAVSSPYTHYNATLFSGGTIHIYFKDEETLECVNNVDLEIFSENQTGNVSTSTCFMSLAGYLPSFYTMRWSSPTTTDYFERYFFLNLTNTSFYNLTFWMLNTSDQTLLTVYDQNSNFLESSYVKVLRYDIDTNSYILREIAKTNFEGQAKVSLATNTEFYRFFLEYPFGTVVTQTNPAYIYATSVDLVANLEGVTAEDFFNSMGVTAGITYNNATDTFRFSYNDPSMAMETGCLSVYKKDLEGGYQEYVNETCVSSTAAVILIENAYENNTEYIAKGTINYGNGALLVAETRETFEVAPPLGPNMVWVALVLTFMAVALVYWNKALALIIAPVPSLMLSMVGWLRIDLPYLFGVEVLFIIIALYISKE